MRTYLVFGSDDEQDWELLGEWAASGAASARNNGLDTKAYNHYAAVPKRNWSAASPQVVQRPPVVRWSDSVPGQLSVEDVLKEAEQEGLLEEVPEKEPTRPADTVGL